MNSQPRIWPSALCALLAAFGPHAAAQETPAAPQVSVPFKSAPESAQPPSAENNSGALDGARTLAPLDEATRARLEPLFEGALLDTRNGDDFLETTGYRRLIEIVSSYTPEEVHAKVTRDLDYPDAIAHPENWQGEFVRVRGLIGNMHAVKLARPIWDHPDVYQGVLAQPDGAEGLIFELLDAPPDVRLREDVVDLEGVFYRTLKYQRQITKYGKTQTAPYLIVRNITLVDTKVAKTDRGAVDYIAKILIGLGVIYVVFRVVTLLRKQRVYVPRGAAEPDAPFSVKDALRERANSQRDPP